MLASVISVITPSSLSKAVAKVFIKETQVDGLINSSSTESFIHPDLVKRHSLTVHLSSGSVSMASTSLSQQSLGYCLIDLSVNGQDYKNVRLNVLSYLCSEVIVGQDFQRLHKRVTMEYEANCLLLSFAALPH